MSDRDLWEKLDKDSKSLTADEIESMLGDNAERYWYSFYNGITQGVFGWCFGKTRADAIQDAIKSANMFGSRLSPGNYCLSLQQDITPKVYSDHKVTIT